MIQNISSHFSMEYETDRLILKVLTPDYAPAVCDFLYRNRESFEPYEPIQPSNYYTTDYISGVLSAEMKLALKTQTIRYYVFLKEDPMTIIGTVCLHDIRQSAYSCCEIGYKFDFAYRHLGYAREATMMAVSIAFAALNIHRVFARVMPDNEPSIRLLRSLSFHEEGLERQSICIRGQWRDHLRFAILNES